MKQNKVLQWRIFSAFTLAEVLIVLGIIGIIADMTIPSLIKSTDRQTTIVRLKKTYSVLSQAIQMAEIENSNHSGWDYSNANTFYATYLKPYLNISREFINEKIPNYVVFSLDGQVHASSGLTNVDYPKFMLNDGTIVSLGNNDENYQGIAFDINGTQKPNRHGKDIFSFTIGENVPFLAPYGTNTDDLSKPTRASIINGGYCSKTPHQLNGVYCTLVIMEDGWRIADDYPW